MMIIPLAGAQNSISELNFMNYSTIDSDTKNVTNFVASDATIKDELSLTTSLGTSQIPHTAGILPSIDM